MSIKLYKMDWSPPARAAMMACELFGVPAEMIEVKLHEGEHRTPDYLKKNPLHTVPVLQDGDLIIHDSHAILMYLADSYGKEDSLYPKDVKQRALVDQKLFFNAAILFPKLRNITYPAIMEGVRQVTNKQLEEIREAYGYLEEFLSRTTYLAADHITIADIAAIATVTSLVYFVSIKAEKYPRLYAWLETLKRQPYCEKRNAPGATQLGELLKKLLDI